MRILGVETSDFAIYYDVVEALRRRGIPFATVAPGEPLPPHVGAVIVASRAALDAEVPRIPFTTPDDTVDRALQALHAADGPVRRLVIGIDPGERPGMAVLADGHVVRLAHLPSPEAVRPAVDAVLGSIRADAFVVRVGDGAPTFRDRILRALAGLDVPVERVDERRSTPTSYHGSAERDTLAATRIGLTPGEVLRRGDVPRVHPTEGELRDIQRKSRVASDGRLTISRTLARRVALGRLTLEEAIAAQASDA